jgi:MFS family permease
MPYSLDDSMIPNTDHQDGQPHPTLNHQSPTEAHDSPDWSTARDQKSDVARHKTSGYTNGPEVEAGLSYISLKDERSYDAAKPDAATNLESSQDVPKLPFSITRVWVSAVFIMVVYIVVVVSLGPLSAQYFFHRFAEDLHYNSSSPNKQPCSNSTVIGDTSMAQAQREASSTLLYATIASCIPAFVTGLFAGSVSDFLGRRILIICCLSGAICKVAIFCLIIQFHLNVQFIYLASVLDGVVGSLFMMTVAITAIIADVTPNLGSKAVKFAIVEGIILICAALSQVVVGYLIKEAGFLVPSVICVALLVVCLIVTIFILPETMRKKQVFTWNVLTHVKKTFGFYVYGGTMSRRCLFNIGLAIHLVVMFANLGRATVETMFMLNWPICWNSVDIGIFGAVRTVVMALAGIALLKVCKGRLSLEVTGMICGVSSAAGFIMEALADSTLMMYLSAIAGILFTASLPLPRAIMSQLASPSEQGALFSGMSCIEAFATMVSSTIYTLIYNATLETFRGAVFMAVAFTCAIGIVFFGINRQMRLSTFNKYKLMPDDSVSTTTNYQSIGNNLPNSGNVPEPVNT